MVTSTVDRARGAVTRRLRRAERTTHRVALGVGRRVTCPVCDWHGVRFAPSARPRRPNRICPQCGSSERDRALALWLARRHHDAGARILEIAPIGLLEDRCAAKGLTHVGLDLHSPRADVRGDLCALPAPNASVDLLVCFHVLEHVPDDHAAMAEMARVLASDGAAVISVPWDPSLDATDEDPDAGPEERLRRFGQIDHVRTYGRDLGARLAGAGLEVSERRWVDLFGDACMERHALDGDDDRFWICTRRS